MEFIAIIPARYASTRFPAKPLARLAGKSVVERVYGQACKVFEHVCVATDHKAIYDAVKEFGGEVVMTSPDHKSGTDRCYEAFCKCGVKADVVVNIQGDEPFVHSTQLETLKSLFDTPDTQIATLVKPFAPETTFAQLQNPNSPKVVLSESREALYFSRSVIPYLRGEEPDTWAARHEYYKHIGLYAFRSDVLGRITSLPQTSLEISESLEQLRWLGAGLKIKVGLTDVETIGIDTPEDLARAEEWIKEGRA